jgi:hypothetical protein
MPWKEAKSDNVLRRYVFSVTLPTSGNYVLHYFWPIRQFLLIIRVALVASKINMKMKGFETVPTSLRYYSVNEQLTDLKSITPNFHPVTFKGYIWKHLYWAIPEARTNIFCKANEAIHRVGGAAPVDCEASL